MADCLVIGGNGFLGSLLVDALAAAGHDVAVFDRFSSDPAWTADGVRILRGDFSGADAVARAVDGRDAVFHFLSTTTPASADADPERDLVGNLAPTVAMLEAAVRGGVGKVYFASTGGAIYGDQQVERFGEEVVPAPVSPYAIGKLAIEGYLRYFRRKHGLDSVAFRISNPYGPRQRPDRGQGVIPTFLSHIAVGRPLTVLGDGSMVRDYVYADDVARMIAATVGRPTRSQVYNIGSGTGTSIAELVDLVGEVTGARVEVERAPMPATFVERVVLDVSRFSDEFGTGDLVPLRDGLAATWRAIRKAAS